MMERSTFHWKSWGTCALLYLIACTLGSGYANEYQEMSRSSFAPVEGFRWQDHTKSTLTYYESEYGYNKIVKSWNAGQGGKITLDNGSFLPLIEREGANWILEPDGNIYFCTVCAGWSGDRPTWISGGGTAAAQSADSVDKGSFSIFVTRVSDTQSQNQFQCLELFYESNRRSGWMECRIPLALD